MDDLGVPPFMETPFMVFPCLYGVEILSILPFSLHDERLLWVCATPRLSIKYVSKNVKYKCLHRYAIIQTSMFIVLIFRHFFCNVPCCNLSTCEVRRWATTRWNFSRCNGLARQDGIGIRLMQNRLFYQYNWYQLIPFFSRFTYF